MFRRLAQALLLCILAGCTTNNVIIVAPGAQARVACPLPPNSPAVKPPGMPVIQTNPVWPPQAMASHVPGCAGVLFRLSPEGLPIEQRIVVENPPNFGFGLTAMTALSGNTYKPSGNGWHYATYTLAFVQSRNRM